MWNCHLLVINKYTFQLNLNQEGSGIGDDYKNTLFFEEQHHNSKFDKMDLSVLVKSQFHYAYFSKSIIAASSKLTREREQKS